MGFLTKVLKRATIMRPMPQLMGFRVARHETMMVILSASVWILYFKESFMKLSVIALSVYSVIFAASSVWADVAVIVNPNVITAPSQSDVANVFLGKDKTLKGVDQKD